MTQLRDLFDESAGATPPSSLRADAVYAAGRRRRTLVAAARSAVVVLTVMAASSAAYGAIRLTTRPTEPGESARHTSVMEYAVDGEHVYAIVIDCPVSPSTDPSPGHSWTDPPATPTIEPTTDPTVDPTLDPTVDPTLDPTVDPTLDPSPDPTTGLTLDPTQPPVDPTTGPPVDPTAGPVPTLEPTPPTPSPYDPCTTRLIASDDRGRHWSARTREPSHYGLTSPAPGVLATSASIYDDEPMISTDGARTWRRVTRTDTGIPRVPAGGWATTATPGDGKVLGVDPGNVQVAPLANQPPFKVADVTYVPGTGIIVATSDGGPLDIAADAKFAISEDNGHSWSPARALPSSTQPTADGPGTVRMPIQHAVITTVDGTNVYLVRRGAPGTGVVVVHSSSNGGATWKKRTLADVDIVGSYVTPDGAHVVVSAADSGTSFRVSRDRGASYQRIARMAGLPARAGTFFVRTLPQGDYVAQEVNSFPGPLVGPTFYHSTDGWNWERIDVG